MWARRRLGTGFRGGATTATTTQLCDLGSMDTSCSSSIIRSLPGSRFVLNRFHACRCAVQQGINMCVVRGPLHCPPTPYSPCAAYGPVVLPTHADSLALSTHHSSPRPHPKPSHPRERRREGERERERERDYACIDLECRKPANDFSLVFVVLSNVWYWSGPHCLQ